MIPVAIVLVCLALFIILCKQMEDSVNRVIKWIRKADERISTLEVHENKQDYELYAHGARLDNQQKLIKLTREDLKEMGKDVGWTDDNRKTQVLKLPDPPEEDG